MTDVRVIHLAESVPHYRQRTVLDGVEYVLDLRWSTRERCWYLDLRDLHGRALVLGIKLVPEWPLFAVYRAVEGLPPGELFGTASAPPQLLYIESRP